MISPHVALPLCSAYRSLCSSLPQRQSNHITEQDSPLTQGNSSSGSQASSLEENSTASGYAATGSASSVESVPIEIPSGHIQSQFTYPLEKLLSQPHCYNVDSDDISPISLDTHSHRGNNDNRKNKSQNGLKICATQTSYSLDPRQHRTHSETKLLGPPHRTRPYNPSQALGQSSRYQSGRITVDV